MHLIIIVPLAANSQSCTALGLEIIAWSPAIYLSVDLKRFFWFNTKRQRKNRWTVRAPLQRWRALKNKRNIFFVTVALSPWKVCVCVCEWLCHMASFSERTHWNIMLLLSDLAWLLFVWIFLLLKIRQSRTAAFINLPILSYRPIQRWPWLLHAYGRLPIKINVSKRTWIMSYSKSHIWKLGGASLKKTQPSVRAERERKHKEFILFYYYPQKKKMPSEYRVE